MIVDLFAVGLVGLGGGVANIALEGIVTRAIAKMPDIDAFCMIFSIIGAVE